MRSKLVLPIILCLNTSVFAENIHLTGTTEYSILPQKQGLLLKASAKKIKLMTFSLSKTASNRLHSNIQSAHNNSLIAAKSLDLPEEVQLGMNNVPVLDQGHYGSCVTFASTAALEALLNKGDYVSQTCFLQLGNYLEKEAYEYSGWKGSTGRLVLSTIDKFGIVNKEQEAQKGCGGLFSYPQTGDVPTTHINAEDYHQLSENMRRNFAWIPLLDVFEQFNNHADESPIDRQKLIQRIKIALKNNNRVTMGVFLPGISFGLAGATARQHAENDTWVLSPEIIHEALFGSRFLPGHEMIITGYDDNAIAVDNLGRKYKGLFTLRNSWGADVGDKGDFYMSYEYFGALASEAQEIFEETDAQDDSE